MSETNPDSQIEDKQQETTPVAAVEEGKSEPVVDSEPAAPVEANGKEGGAIVADGEAAAVENTGEAKPQETAAPKEEPAKPEPAPLLEAPTENPFNEDDLEAILQLEASEGEDKGWEKAKKIKGVTISKKPEKNGAPIIKAYMEFSGIPCDKVLELFTDPDLRKKWSRKTPNYEILEERTDFNIIYSVFKMPMSCNNRDVVQCVQVRSDEEQKRHVVLYKSCSHPNKPPSKGTVRADVGIMGLVIRPKDGDDQSTRVTWLSQIGLKGWALKMIASRVNLGYPVSLSDDLQQYWKKTTAPKEPPKTEEADKAAGETPPAAKDEGKTDEPAADTTAAATPAENNVAEAAKPTEPITGEDDIPAADAEVKAEDAQAQPAEA